jgi:hypothetical protein
MTSMQALRPLGDAIAPALDLVADGVRGVGAVAREGIEQELPPVLRASRAAGAFDRARGAIDGRTFHELDELRFATGAAREAASAGVDWLDRLPTHDRAANAVIAAAHRRVEQAVQLLPDPGSQLIAPSQRAAEHLGVARDLADGVGAYLQLVPEGPVARVAAADPRAEAATLLRGAAARLRTPSADSAGASAQGALMRSNELVGHRVARTTEALSALARARDLLGAVPGREAAELHEATGQLVRRVLRSMAEGLPTLRHPQVARDAAALAAHAARG